MTDEELIARLRKYKDDLLSITADRIKALVKERDEALEWLSASQGYIADAVFALDKQEKAEARAEAAEAEVEKLREVERAARKLEENLGVDGVNVGSLRVDLYRALAAALTQKEPTDGE